MELDKLGSVTLEGRQSAVEVVHDHENASFLAVSDVVDDRKATRHRNNELIVPDVVDERLFGTSAQLLLSIIALTFLYWVLSGGLTLFNKWFFSTRGFRFPIMVVMGTFLLHFLIMASLRWISTRCEIALMPQSQTVQRSIYLKYLVPIGICTAFEIASSNLALLKLSVSFHTMVHASKPIFIAAWSVGIGLEKMNAKLFLIVGTVALGVALLSIGESNVNRLGTNLTGNNSTATVLNSPIEELDQDGSRVELSSPHHDPGFNIDGFLLILFSCFCSGARWALVQMMLQRIDISTMQQPITITEPSRPSVPDPSTIAVNPATSIKNRLTPMNLVFYAAPISALSLLPFFLGAEFSGFAHYTEEAGATGDLFAFEIVVGIWSLFLNLTEFYFVRKTSGLFLSFAAISKELLLVAFAVVFNGDDLPFLNVLGFVMCITGIIMYHRTSHETTINNYQTVQAQDQSAQNINAATAERA